MAFSYSPKIVTEGLVLYLDAGNQLSYPGSGTTWNDLSRSQLSGSLVNGPTYNSANLGSIVFDGVDDYVTSNVSSNIQDNIGTCCCWVKTSTPGSSFRGIIVKQQGWGLFVLDGVFATYDWGNPNTRSTGINIATGMWNYVAMSFTDISGTPSNNASLYLNGSLVLITTIQKSSPTATITLASGSPGGSQFLNGNIAAAQLYNRALSAQEVLQNYNATKTRFGLT
jgi:hypothetical protein